VAWFTIAAVLGKPITIYGNGKQIRDVLHVDDLVAAYEAAISHQEAASGQAFNVGGGTERTLSLLELLRQLEEMIGRETSLKYSDWRPGDQPVFVCDVEKANQRLGWEPRISVREGVKRLYEWVVMNRSEFGWLQT